MASENGSAGLAAGVGALIGVAAANLAARAGKASGQTATASGDILEVIAQFSEATSRASVASLDNLETLVARTEQALQTLQTLAATLGVTGVGENPRTFAAFGVATQAANTPIELPSRPVPATMQVMVLAWPTNLGTIYVAPTDTDARGFLASSFPLIAGQFILLKVRNTNAIHFTSTVAGEGVSVLVEQTGGQR